MKFLSFRTLWTWFGRLSQKHPMQKMLDMQLMLTGQVARLVLTWPIVFIALPVAAVGDARHPSGRPDLFPVRERIMYYLADWWVWVTTGEFRSQRTRLVVVKGSNK